MGNSFASNSIRHTYEPVQSASFPDYEPTVIASDNYKVTVTVSVANGEFAPFNKASETRTMYVPHDQVSAVANNIFTAAFTVPRNEKL